MEIRESALFRSTIHCCRSDVSKCSGIAAVPIFVPARESMTELPTDVGPELSFVLPRKCKNIVLQYAITYNSVLGKCRNKPLKYVTISFLVYFNFSLTMVITVYSSGRVVLVYTFDTVLLTNGTYR
jgi:hypothetical protein